MHPASDLEFAVPLIHENLSQFSASAQVPAYLQVEAGGYGAGCSNDLPGSPADPTYDNPTYTIYDPASGTLSGDVPLPILADAWPINLYPYLVVLPHSGRPSLCYLCYMLRSVRTIMASVAEASSFCNLCKWHMGFLFCASAA